MVTNSNEHTELAYHDEQYYCTRLKSYAEGVLTRSAVCMVASMILLTLGMTAFESNLTAAVTGFIFSAVVFVLSVYYYRLSVKIDDSVIESSGKASNIRTRLEVTHGIKDYMAANPGAYTPPQYGNPPRR